MKLIYIAGPFRGNVEENIAAAVSAGEKVKADGRAFPIVPHLLGGPPNTQCRDEYILAGTLELMRRCDAVFALPTWQSSVGAKGEIAEAEQQGIPVFYKFDQLFRWLSL